MMLNRPSSSLCFVILLVVLQGLFALPAAAAASSSPTMPKKMFHTTFPVEAVTGVYTNPHGVNGSSSPFFVVTQNHFYTISATGQPLKHLGFNTFSNRVKPFVNYDASNNTVFVAVNTVWLPNSVSAFDIDTMKAKWTFHPVSCGPQYDYVCHVVTMMYVEPELVKGLCSSGAGGVVFMICATASPPTYDTCGAFLIDIDNGKLCSEYKFDGISQPKSKNVQVFPSGGALKRPVIVVMCEVLRLVHGIDALTGETIYKVPLGPQLYNLVPGPSPTNEYFAYHCYNSTLQEHVMVFRRIDDGTLRLEAPVNTSKYVFTSFSWTAFSNTSNFGGVIMYGVVESEQKSIARFVSAFNGEEKILELFDGRQLTPFHNVDNQWAMSVGELGNASEYKIIGIPLTPNESKFEYPLPLVPASPFEVVTDFWVRPFIFLDDSSGGVASLSWRNGHANLTVFRV